MKQIPQELKASLRKAGLDRTQVEIIVALSGAEPLSIHDVAQVVHLPRSSVHLAIEELVEKGAVLVQKQGKRRFFYIDSPLRLRQIISYDETSINERKSILERTLPELQALFTISRGEEPIEIEELAGEDGFVETFYRSLEGSHREILRFGGEAEKFTIAREKLKTFREKREKKKIKVRLLLPESPFAEFEKQDALGKSRDVRSIPKEIYNPDVQTSIFGDTVAFTVWDKGLHTAIVKNSKIAGLLSSLFNIAWQNGK